MSRKRQYTKEAMDSALKFIHEEDGTIREAAKRFGVPRSSIQFKIRNPHTKFKSGPDPVLTEAEENDLCDFIIKLAKLGFPRKKEDIQLCVQDFLKKNPRKNPFRDGKPGDVWFKAFLRRHPNISILTSEGVTNASACVSEKDVRKWFAEIRHYIDEENLSEAIQDPTRVFNADETGFNICPKTGKVLAERGCKNVYEIEKGPAKENITVLFTFSANGTVCSPLIIYPYKRIPDRVTLSVPSGWGIGRSETGWMTASIFYDYIANCFYNHLTENKIQLPVILFVDGHKTHLTLDVAELCRSLKIHLIALYPNATRILQPADVAAFRPIKVGWKKALREWHATNNYQSNLTKENFAPLLKNVVDACAKPETLINGFRITGLYPFNPDNVDFSKCLATEKESEPETSPSVNNIILTYSQFCNLVGSALITKCETTTVNSLLMEDDSFMAIYKIWQNFNDVYNVQKNDFSSQETPVNMITITYDACNTMILPDDSYVPDFILDEFTGYLLDNRDSNNTILQDKSTSGTMKIDKYDNMSPVLDHTEFSGSTNISSGDTAQNLVQKGIEIWKDSEPFKIIDPNKEIRVISSQPLSEYLKRKTRPCSPKRKGKRQTDKMPFALTSNYCLEMMKEKNTKKQEEEAAKQERKRLRDEKRVLKVKVPKKKIKGKEVNTKTENKLSDKIKLICCDHCLSPITTRIIECSQCNKNFHFNCIPSSHRHHIPENDDNDPFLCHMCYRESNTDSSDNDAELTFALIRQEMDKQGF